MQRVQWQQILRSERFELIQAALLFAPLLQIPLAEQVQETLTTVQEAPMVAKVITVCVVMMIVLGFLEKYFKSLSALLEYLLKIREQLINLGTAPTSAELDTQADRAKLLKAFTIKLNKRLADVLSSEQLIALSWEDRPQEVGRIQREIPAPESVPESVPNFMTRLQSLSPVRLFKRPQQQAIELPPSERLMDVFTQGDVAGRLLILGAPGSGKTTTLLELARELVATAEADETAPVPIIFELSNWTNAQQSIDQWLVAQLKAEYNVSPKVGQHWIATHQILPLLDGLDELGGVRLPKCVEKLNAFLPDTEPDRQAVVCCRTKEFRRG
ncbi:MAG: NACHT domain-containing protein, partial [Cyanobacteria bacterium P01_C01_bin.147]